MRPILTRNRRDCIRQVWAVSGMVPSLRLPRRDGAGKQLVAAQVYPGFRREARLTPGFVRAVALRLRFAIRSRSPLSSLLSPLTHHLSNPGRRVATPIRDSFSRSEEETGAGTFDAVDWVGC
jgi:hypothetical protein